SVGVAGGLGVAAAVLAVYGIGFAFATVAAGLSEVLAWWLSLLIVTAITFRPAAIAAFLAKRFARKASPPKPAAAIEEAERTIGTLQSHVCADSRRHTERACRRTTASRRRPGQAEIRCSLTRAVHGRRPRRRRG